MVICQLQYLNIICVFSGILYGDLSVTLSHHKVFSMGYCMVICQLHYLNIKCFQWDTVW